MESEQLQPPRARAPMELLRRLLGYFQGSSPGMSFIEYLMIAGMLSLGAIAGFQHLSGARNSAVQEQAHTVRDIPDRAPPPGLISGPGSGIGSLPGLNGPNGPGLGVVPTPGGRPTLPVIQPTQCFAAGTVVATEDGQRPIEALAVGDLVWSRNVATGATELKQVVTTFVTESWPVLGVQVRLDGLRSERLLVTGDHPFFSEEKGMFVPARSLASEPVGALGASPLVAALESYASRVTVYNLEVADFHTYFVGEEKLLSHDVTEEEPTDVVVPGMTGD